MQMLSEGGADAQDASNAVITINGLGAILTANKIACTMFGCVCSHDVCLQHQHKILSRAALSC